MLAIIKIIISIYVMWKVSSSFDLAANYITRNWGEGIKGPTINAIASSLPELLISSMFLFYYKDIIGFSAGYATIIGSSAFNIAIIPVVSYAIVFYKNRNVEFKIDKKIIFQDSIFLLISIIILLSGFIIGVNIYLSILLISLYCMYVYFVYSSRKKSSNIHEINEKIFNEKILKGKGKYTSSILNIRLFDILNMKKINNLNSYIVIFISVILIGSSCWILVEAVDNISTSYNISLFITAFFIAAISSSIPDTILSVKDAKHEKFADSFSNSYGSNIFDICIGIGLPVLIFSIFYDSSSIEMNIPIDTVGFLNIGDYIAGGNLFLWSLIILFIFTSVVSIVYYTGKINLKNSIIILLVYLMFIIALLGF